MPFEDYQEQGFEDAKQQHFEQGKWTLESYLLSHLSFKFTFTLYAMHESII